MQGRLVDDRSDEHGRAVARVSQGHPAEPLGPAAVEASLQADLVTPRLMAVVVRSAALVHLAPSAVHVSAMSASATAEEPKVDGKVGAAHPHLWGVRWGLLAVAT